MSATETECRAEAEKRGEHARWYAYGRQDQEGPEAKDTGIAGEFVNYYRDLTYRWMKGETGLMRNIAGAYEDWHAERFPVE